MRLIDADKLKTQFPEPADWLDINQTLVHKTGIWAEIDAAETVEAIPVDWIESYALLAEADGRPFFAEGIRDMVEEWKKEQKGN